MEFYFGTHTERFSHQDNKVLQKFLWMLKIFFWLREREERLCIAGRSVEMCETIEKKNQECHVPREFFSLKCSTIVQEGKKSIFLCSMWHCVCVCECTFEPLGYSTVVFWKGGVTYIHTISSNVMFLFNVRDTNVWIWIIQMATNPRILFPDILCEKFPLVTASKQNTKIGRSNWNNDDEKKRKTKRKQETKIMK